MLAEKTKTGMNFITKI